MKLTQKKMDKLIDEAYNRLGKGVQINIMDISKVFAMGRAALTNGTDLDAAINEAIAKLRQN